jgi:hypothetical protein
MLVVIKYYIFIVCFYIMHLIMDMSPNVVVIFLG